MDIPISEIINDAIKILSVALLVGGVVYIMNRSPHVYQTKEGFHGHERPNCLRTLPESSRLLDMLTSRVKTTSPLMEARPDYKELELILSKLACLKTDLLSPTGQLDATRFMSFETAHDRISVAELAGLCLSKNIPLRDLDISFQTWHERAMLLIRKLCTELQLSEKEVRDIEALFNTCYTTVYDIARSKCIKIDLKVNDGDVAAAEQPKNKNLRNYQYSYGGIFASGWN